MSEFDIYDNSDRDTIKQLQARVTELEALLEKQGELMKKDRLQIVEQSERVKELEASQIHRWPNIITELKARVKELEAERERAYKDAGDLCLSLYKKHFYEEGNDFGLCDSIVGIISQLDNMSCSMVSQARVKELETAIKTADPIELGRIKNELEKGEG